jgi:ubiquinone/menaquinone biosynthesis C-methylase UbiE
VARHYGRGSTLNAILAALRNSGKDPAPVTLADLAPVDEFHLRGREATVELAQRAQLQPGQRVLDVGCGLGGSARYLAAEHRCVVTGVDLTEEYVEVARELSWLVGLQDRVNYHAASALELPFEDASFDVAWTEYAQMNIDDKHAFYGETARVLVPGGRLAFHDVFQGAGGTPLFPVPWAEDASISFLATPEQVRAILERLGFRMVDWIDKSAQTHDWLVDKLGQPPAPLGLHLLMGTNARTKFENIVRNLQQNRVVVLQAVAQKNTVPRADSEVAAF